MRLVASRRTGTAITGRAEVRVALRRAGGEQILLRIARTRRKLRRARRNVVDHPVPPPASGGCVRIIRGDREALRPRGRTAPLEGRRHVAPGTPHSVEYL